MLHEMSKDRCANLCARLCNLTAHELRNSISSQSSSLLNRLTVGDHSVLLTCPPGAYHIPSSASSQLSWGYRGLLGLLKSCLAPKGPCCVSLLCFDSEIPMALLAWASCLCCQVRFCQLEVPKWHSARDHMEEGMKRKKGTGPHSQPSLLESPWSYSPDFSSSGHARWISHHAAFTEPESQAILSAFHYAVCIVAFDSWPHRLTANTTQNYIMFPWGRRSNQLLAAQDPRGKRNTTDLKEKKE